MLPALGGEHCFPLWHSLCDAANPPPEACLELILPPCRAISRPKIMLPAYAGSISALWSPKKRFSPLYLFSPSKLTCTFHPNFTRFSKKRFPPSVGSTVLKGTHANSGAESTLQLARLGLLWLPFCVNTSICLFLPAIWPNQDSHFRP